MNFELQRLKKYFRMKKGSHHYPHEFNVIRKKLIRQNLFSFFIMFLGLAIAGTQLFYPFHIFLGVGLYIVSFVPLVLNIYKSRKVWKKFRAYTYAQDFFKRRRRVVSVFFFLFIGMLVFVVLRPLDSDVFTNVSDSEIKQIISDDLYQSITAMDFLETTGDELVKALQSDVEDANTAQYIEEKFTEFLTAVMFSESITDKHRYFANIPYRLWDERFVSFTMSYSLYAKKYELVHRVMSEATGSEFKKKILNQFSTLYERNGIYNEMVARFYAPKTRLRINAGALYIRIFRNVGESSYGDARTVLLTKAAEAYTYLLKHFDQTIFKTPEVVVDGLRSNMFDMWFPIQRGVANAMGRIILSTRGKEGLISESHIIEMQKMMEPGDFMLQRRNWHISNVGIPGFWTHAALYTGDLETLDRYFASEFPYEGYDSISSYIETKFPNVYSLYSTPDADGNKRSVIEAIDPEVLVQSLTKSANADFVVVLRPNLSKHDTMLALFKAFGHVGKPYDYNFDFDTRDALVCSELIYDAYYSKPPEKKGLVFKTSLVNGRKIVSPIDIATKYASEEDQKDAQLSFVYFIRSNENDNSVRSATREEFIESIEWSKFSFLQDTQVPL